jgi:hypothetical protein
MIGSTILVALTTLLASPGTESLVWQKDYATALQRGKETGKPLAVFLGKGANGWQSVTKEGKIDAKTTELLSQKYVCLYVDLSDEAGKHLADSFELHSTPGLVISSPGGAVQAYRHEGELQPSDLQQNLVRYSDPTRPVVTTEGAPVQRTSLYPPNTPSYYTPGYQAIPGQLTTIPGWNPPGYCPSCQRR